MIGYFSQDLFCDTIKWQSTDCARILTEGEKNTRRGLNCVDFFKLFLRQCLFWLFSMKKWFYKPKKWKLSFKRCLVWLLRIVSILQKQFSLKLQFLAFGFSRINSTIKLISIPWLPLIIINFCHPFSNHICFFLPETLISFLHCQVFSN